MIIELFKQITQIPRCSGTHEPFINFIKEYSLKYNYICNIDNANNILCYKKNTNSQICLQAHYDIVCLEDGKIPQIYTKDDFLMAKDSTLGADNGIGCAYMLALMQENIDCEYLFTCDEEIGLIGANNINLNINSPSMLNLDSEEMGEVCIGCAGGVDIFANINNSKLVQNSSNKILYEVEVSGLAGGHSGVDINKNIPNAFKILINCLDNYKDIDLIDINGGERINSIPKYAKAIVGSKNQIKSDNEFVKITKIDSISEHYKVLPSSILKFISNLQNGVLKYDENLDVVIDSINIAIIKTNINDVKISLSARSMDNDNLNEINTKVSNDLKNLGFEVKSDGKYPAWKPDTNEFTNIVLQKYKKHFKNTSLYAIHAGLECAIFKDKYPHLNIASIGPNIYFPHSNREKCDIKSVYKVYEILKDIIK